MLEEGLGLLRPGAHPGLVEGVHQPPHIDLGEAAAEVSGGGRVGDTLGPQRIEVDLVIPSHLQMFQSAAAGQEVVGDREDVIALVIRQVSLEKVEVLVDVVDEPELLGQEVDGPDAAGGDRPDLLGDLVADVGGGDDRLDPLDAGPILDATGDPPLASVQLTVETGVHSKTSWVADGRGGEVPRLFAGTRGFSSFQIPISLGLRLVEG